MKTTFPILILSFCTVLIPRLGYGQNFDQNLLRTINSQETRYDDFWKGTSFSVYPVSLGTPLFLYTLGSIEKSSKTRHQAFVQAGALALNSFVTLGLKWTINRERPYVKDPEIVKKQNTGPFSFPSGHTSLAFATASSLTLAYPKWYIALPSFGWALAVGYSRMHLGVHYPSDVLAGAVVGCLSSYAVFWLNKNYIKK